MILTLAVTVVVPVTADPELGEVMDTTRLPGRGGIGNGNCAKARSGEIQTQLRTTNSAAA